MIFQIVFYDSPHCILFPWYNTVSGYADRYDRLFIIVCSLQSLNIFSVFNVMLMNTVQCLWNLTEKYFTVLKLANLFFFMKLFKVLIVSWIALCHFNAV